MSVDGVRVRWQAGVAGETRRITVDLTLDAAEVAALRRILEAQHGDLRMQIADTDTSTFRDELRAEKAVVLRLLDKLGPGRDAA